MLDRLGYRLNVGIILTNAYGEVFLAKRVGNVDVWQFPQGGIQAYETAEEAMYRELKEEVGLDNDAVNILASTNRWLYYDLPYKLRRPCGNRICIGQKQRWFLLEFVGDERDITFENGTKPEFDAWRWVDYWYPVEHIVEFKREVYKKALQEFSPVLKELYK